MGQALYRTYRSKKLSEIVGQEHITDALAHALKQGTISHAYLFTGPRGVGKTSIARILAHEINDLPYTEGQNYLDIIEIDAASNRRIDEIRDLREKVHVAPASAKYKVYIIDEVHMLTKEAFNALLKTLEEPPAHVVFILATTEVHKLPETIISRTQRYSFKPGEQQKVIGHLRYIAEKENIAIDDEALKLIAEHGEGSFRDSLSLLDQIRNNKDAVNGEMVRAVLGIAPANAIDDILGAVLKHDSANIVLHLKKMSLQGYEAAQIARQVSEKLRSSVIEGSSLLGREIVIDLLTQLLSVAASPSPFTALEIALLDATLAGGELVTQPSGPKVMSETVQAPATATIHITSKERIKASVHEAAGQAVTEKSSAVEAVADRQAIPKVSEEGGQKEDSQSEHSDADMVLTEKAWDIILNALKQKHNTLHNVARSARTHFSPGKITLEVSYAFHQKRLNDPINKQLLFDVIAGVTGSEVSIEAILGEGKPRIMHASLPPADNEVIHAVNNDLSGNATIANTVSAPNKTTANTDPDIDAIANIFGSAEVLES